MKKRRHSRGGIVLDSHELNAAHELQPHPPKQPDKEHLFRKSECPFGKDPGIFIEIGQGSQREVRYFKNIEELYGDDFPLPGETTLQFRTRTGRINPGHQRAKKVPEHPPDTTWRTCAFCNGKYQGPTNSLGYFQHLDSTQHQQRVRLVESGNDTEGQAFCTFFGL
jgi:hypothetical protein